MKRIYVSPHADDVALSCGGQILANPDHRSDTLVLTVFTSEEDPRERVATSHRARFNDSIHRDRDKEDEAAWNSVGVPLRALCLPEALLRGTFPFATSRSARDRQIMGELHDVIAAYMRTYTEAQFYFPSGIGRHIDHLLCRDVAFDILRNDARARITFYEDAPYWWLRFLKRAHYHEVGLLRPTSNPADLSLRYGIDLLQYLVRKNVPFPRGRMLFLAVYAGLLVGAGRGSDLDLKTLRPTITTTTIDAEIFARKRELVFQYASQLPMLFGEAPEALLNRYGDCFATETILELARRPA